MWRSSAAGRQDSTRPWLPPSGGSRCSWPTRPASNGAAPSPAASTIFTPFWKTGEPWDTREAYLGWVTKISRGASNLKIQERVYCDELKAAIDRVERIGISLRDPADRASSSGPRRWAARPHGDQLQRQAAEAQDGQGGPAPGLRGPGPGAGDETASPRRRRLPVLRASTYEPGEFYEVRAKAAVIATGNTNRMFHGQTRSPFNLWYCPANTGDLHRAAFDAGVELANMEYVRMTIVPKGFSAPGFNAFLGMGSHLVNSLGEMYLEKAHPMGEKAPRNFIVWATYRELREGRGPIYMDCRHLTQRDRENPVHDPGVRQGHAARLPRQEGIQPGRDHDRDDRLGTHAGKGLRGERKRHQDR